MTRVLAVVIALLFVTDIVGVAVVSNDDDSPSAQPTASSTTSSSDATTSTSAVTNASPPTTTMQDAFNALAAQIQPFVSEHRGLRFKAPVKVTLLDAGAFRAKVLEISKDDNDELVRTGNEMRALGLLKPGVDLIKARDELLGTAIVGFYDPKAKELFVRGAKITPYVRTTLAHEITHALQDQNFDIDHPDYDKAEDEVGIGFSAIAEGDALRIEEMYRASMSRSDQKAAATEESQAASQLNPKDIPQVLAQLLVFPYTEGPDLITALLRAGGQSRLDAAFAAPPHTTEQVLHPEKFLAGEGPKPVPDPAADGAVIDKGVVGELILRLLLATANSGDDAVTDSTGWGGDRYVAWQANGKTCLRVSWVMDSAQDVSQLRAGLSKWASKQPAATVSTTDPVTVTSCA